MTKQATHANIRNHVAPNLSDWRVNPDHVEYLRHYLMTYYCGKNWSLRVVDNDTYMHLLATKPILAVAQAYCHALRVPRQGTPAAVVLAPELQAAIKASESVTRRSIRDNYATMANALVNIVKCSSGGDAQMEVARNALADIGNPVDMDGLPLSHDPTPYQEALADVVIPVEDALRALVRSDKATTRGCKVAALVRAQSMLSKAKRELSKLLR